MRIKAPYSASIYRRTKCWLMGCLWLTAFSTPAAPGDVDLTFNPGATFGFNSWGMGVVALGRTAVQPDGKVLICGLYNNLKSVFGYPRNNLARLNADGSLDSGFQQGMAGLDGRVSAFALQSDGKIIIGGDFTMVNGVSRHFLARLNTNGSLDTSFLSGLAGPDSTVYSVCLQSNGQILVGGSFTNLNGSLRPRLARLYSDGSVDLGFAGASYGLYDSIQDITVQADGKVIAAGRITTVNSVARGNLARFNPDGSLDTTFLTGMPGTDGDVTQTIIQPDGRVLIAGRFSSVNGFQQSWIARLESDGKADTNFLVNLEGSIRHSSVWMGLQADGRIVMAANFINADGSAKNCLARVNSDGSTDRGFPNFEIKQNHELGVNGISMAADGRVIVSGGFNYRSGGAAGRYLCRVNADGTLDETFQCQKGIDNPVLMVVPQPDGKALLAGKFMSIGGVAREGFARLNTNGSLDLTMTNLVVTTFWQLVRCCAQQSDGKIVLGGDFLYTNGLPQRGLMRLNSDGSYDPSFLPGMAGVNEAVWALALVDGGKILVGGVFKSLNGLAITNLARLNADGSVDPSFLGSSPGNVQAITVQSDGKILLCGNPYSGANLTRLNPDGTLDSSFVGSANDVRSMVVQPNDGKILIGGGFTTVNGQPKNFIARLNANGSLDTLFAPSVTGNYPAVNSVALQPDGKILIGGESIWTVNGLGHTNLARLNSDGSSDITFLSGLSGPDGKVSTVTMNQDLKILIGGEIISVNGVGQSFVARLESGLNPSPTIMVNPQSQTVRILSNATFTVTVQGAAPLAYQWLFNQTNAILGATNSVLPLTNIQTSQAGYYSVVVTNAFGSVVSAPARLTVSSPILADCSEEALRAALAEGGTVTFACDGNVVLSNTIIISNNAVLDASGHQVTISGNNAVRIFYVNSNINFTVANLLLANGRSAKGGAIYNDGGNVSALGCFFRDNQVLGTNSYVAFQPGGSAAGGAIYNTGTLRLSDCMVSNNLAAGGAGSDHSLTFYGGTAGGSASGGAIHSTGTLTIMNCVLQSNRSGGGSGGRGTGTSVPGGGSGGDSFGGAIAGSGQFFLTNTTFSGNSSRGGNASPEYYTGSGGNAAGGGIQWVGGTIYAENCRFSTNRVFGGLLGSSKSGPNGTAWGGGVSAQSATTTFINSVMTTSAAAGEGAEGGGIRLDGGSLKIENCTISNNRVEGVRSSSYYGRIVTPCRGGGVYANSQTEVTECTIADNVVLGGDSGGGYQPGDGGLAMGGGVFCNALSVRQSTLRGNTVTGGAGAVPNSTWPGSARGMGNGGGLASELSGSRIENCTIAENSASSRGGGVYAGGSNYIQSATVVSNAVFPVTGYGGGIYCSGNPRIQNTIVALNNAAGDISGNFTGDHNLIGADPLLAPLANNGGPTLTMALLPSSPAINAADALTAPPTDQRGLVRIGPPDVGAFEYWAQPPAPPNIVQLPPAQTAEAGESLNLRASVSGYPPPVCLWFFNQTNFLGSTTKRVMPLGNAGFEHAGIYTLTVSNLFGWATSGPSLLNVIPPVERRLVPGILILGEAGRNVTVAYADGVTPTPVWSPLSTTALTSLTEYTFDLTSPVLAQRYYRASYAAPTGADLMLDIHLIPALNLTNNPGNQIRVEAINAIGPTDAWFTLATVTLTNPPQLYFDVTAPGQPRRLYRLVPLP